MSTPLAELKVCFLAGTLGCGGAERQLYYILRALKEAGAAVRLLTLTRDEFWEQPIRDLGVPITWVGKAKSRLARLATIVGALRSDRPQIIQSQHFYTNLYAAGAARALGIRELGALRNDGRSEVLANGALLGRMSLRIPRSLAANSKSAINWAVSAGRPTQRLEFLPNVVDPPKHSDFERLPETTFRLLCVGRLHRQKRIDIFLKAVARIRASNHRVQAVVAGEGPERESLDRLRHELGLPPNTIEFIGHAPDPAVLYQKADALVLTSDWEGTPNVVLEAMANGLPVIATHVGGLPEIVQEGTTGFLIPPGDVNMLVRRALQLLDDPAIRVRQGRCAREYVLRHHSPCVLPVRLQEIYDAVLA